MGIRAGRMDRQITIESESLAANAIGEMIKTWSTFATVWAEAKPMVASERYRSDAIRASKVTRFTCRYLSGVLPTMRINYNSELYRITGISELGRQEGLELLGEALA